MRARRAMMIDHLSPAMIARRDWLKLSSAALAGAALARPAPGRAETPRRGGTITIRAWDPPHFDPYLVLAFKTQIVYSFTHSRLLKHRAGPSVAPGSFALEGDLAESWTQPGNPQNYLLGAVDRVEATDRYTVKVTLKEPYVWFPDIVANPMTGAIVAREAVEKFGDLKKWEATVGTGPWMLESY